MVEIQKTHHCHHELISHFTQHLRTPWTWRLEQWKEGGTAVEKDGKNMMKNVEHMVKNVEML